MCDLFDKNAWLMIPVLNIAGKPCHTELPLSKLGLDRCKLYTVTYSVRMVALDLNTHSIQYATKFINMRTSYIYDFEG